MLVKLYHLLHSAQGAYKRCSKPDYFRELTLRYRGSVTEQKTDEQHADFSRPRW